MIKLANLLKEVEDFDLSDNPIAGYPKTITITLDTDEVVEALRQHWDIGELNKDLVLQIQAAIQDEVEYNFTEDYDNLGDLWNGGFLDNIDLDAVNEADDFDLSDNPAAIKYPKTITATVARVSTTTHQGQALINGKHFEQWLDKEHDTSWQEVYDNNEVEDYLSQYAKEYDYSSHFDVDWEETDLDIERYDVDEYEID